MVAQVLRTVYGGVCPLDKSHFHRVWFFALFLQESDPQTVGNHPFDIQGWLSRNRTLLMKIFFAMDSLSFSP
mgnify:CR=1 FL=1